MPELKIRRRRVQYEQPIRHLQHLRELGYPLRDRLARGIHFDRCYECGRPLPASRQITELDDAAQFIAQGSDQIAVCPHCGSRIFSSPRSREFAELSFAEYVDRMLAE